MRQKKISVPVYAFFCIGFLLSVWSVAKLTAIRPPTVWQEVYETPHFQLYYTPDEAKYVATIAALAEKALEELRQAGWERTRTEKIPLRIYPDTAAMAKGCGGDSHMQAMGVYYKGQIGILAVENWMTEPISWHEFEINGPLLHEITHLLVDEMTEENYNLWWTEGVAQYMENKLHQVQLPLEVPETFCSLQELEKHFNKLPIQQAYYQSWQVIEYMVQQYGEAILQTIMHDAAQRQDFSTALTSALDVSIHDFEIQYQAYLENIHQKNGNGV